MIIDAESVCAYCGEVNATTVDLSAGTGQEYVEDCQACCSPTCCAWRSIRKTWKRRFGRELKADFFRLSSGRVFD